MRLLLLALLLTTAAPAQWTLQDAHTTADLRGIDALPNGVAWASGTHGTVLRTEDAGFVWQLCTVPPDAQNLDFRAIQAFSNNTALVMSSGKGPLSRLYKTTDGCQTWQLILTNPDKDGFWDALRVEVVYPPNHPSLVAVIGDPVGGTFPVFYSQDRGDTWTRYTDRKLFAKQGEGLFAASNEALLPPSYTTALSVAFVTGGKAGAFLHTEAWHWLGDLARWQSPSSQRVPMGRTESSGAFAIEKGCAFSGLAKDCPFVVVGGDYRHPELSETTAAYGLIPNHSQNFSKLNAAQTPPHGYRSAVAYDKQANTWITVGPNGTDISTDNGRNWRPLKPSPTDPPDADQHWNALSLPYAVGPHGRIATLQPNRLQ